MSTITKSPRKVLLATYATAQNVLPAYAHRFSPHKFTLSQLFACLVLKTFLKTDYRGITAFLKDCPDLCEVIGLNTVPHFTTLQKAGRKLLQCAVANRLLLETVRSVRKRRIALAAMIRQGWMPDISADTLLSGNAQNSLKPWKKPPTGDFPSWR